MILPRIAYKSKNPILELKVPNSGKSWGWVREGTKGKTSETFPGKEGGSGCVHTEVAMRQVSGKVRESSRRGGALQGGIGHVQGPRAGWRCQGKYEKRVNWSLGKTTAAATTSNLLIGWGFLFPFSAVLTSHIPLFLDIEETEKPNRHGILEELLPSSAFMERGWGRGGKQEETLVILLYCGPAPANAPVAHSTHYVRYCVRYCRQKETEIVVEIGTSLPNPALLTHSGKAWPEK